MAAKAEDTLTRASGEGTLSLVTPFMASSAISDKAKLFPIPRWAPRSGRGMPHHKWMISIARLGKAFNLSADWLQEKPPSTPYYQSLRDNVKLRSGEADADLRARAAHEISTLTAWQAVNTAIFFHVEPSVDYDGTFFMRDSEDIEAMSGAGGLADGRGLIRWCLDKVDITSKVKQRALSRQLGAKRLAVGATRAQFVVHYERLYQHWALILDSDPGDRESLAEFYDHLLDTMPTEPAQSHLVLSLLQ